MSYIVYLFLFSAVSRIKRDLVLLIRKHSEGLPYIEQREKGAEIVVDDGSEDDKNDSAFPDDGGRIV